MNKFLNGEFLLGFVAFVLLVGSQPGLAHALVLGPLPPSALVATAGDAQATVTFTASVTPGVTGYTVTSSPGNITATGTASPITVTGLTNGTSYTFTAIASISGIQSPVPSDPSNAVTPEAPAPVSVGSILPGYNERNPLPWETAAFNAKNEIANTATGTTSVATGTSTAPARVAPYSFTQNLTLGMQSAPVKELQIFLNTNGFLVSDSGPGSKGEETTYFGLRTKAALVRFQSAHAKAILAPFGLSTGTGYFGPSTRAFINTQS